MAINDYRANTLTLGMSHYFHLVHQVGSRSPVLDPLDHRNGHSAHISLPSELLLWLCGAYTSLKDTRHYTHPLIQGKGLRDLVTCNDVSG